MKKILALIALVFAVVTASAQLNIQTVQDYAGYKTVYTVTYFGGKMGEIRYISDQEAPGYYMCGITGNQFEKTMATMYLGPTKDAAILSLKDLKTFYDKSEEGEYVVDGFRTKTHIIISYSMGAKVIQLKSDNAAGVSGIPGFFCMKEKHLNGAIDSITNFTEE